MSRDADRTAEARIHTSAKRTCNEHAMRENTNKAMVRPTQVVVLDKEPDIQHLIRTIRGVQVMLDRDMAKLYGVETGALNRQVKRNEERFPADFMFRLSVEEWNDLKCQNGIPSWGGDRQCPYAFTENGIAMLSSVLRSRTAIEVNIRIMRAFTAIRRFLLANSQVFQRIEAVEKRQIATDAKVDSILERLDEGQVPEKGVFYDGQLWDARAFVDRLVKSAKKSLLLVDNFSRMPPRDSVAGGIRRFFASLGPSLLRKRGHLFPSSRQLVVSSSSSSGRGATRRGHSNPARAGGLPPRARPGFPFRRLPQGSRQEVLRLHEDGLHGDSGLEGKDLTPLAASAVSHLPTPSLGDLPTCRPADLIQVAKSTGRQVASGRGAARRGHSNPARAGGRKRPAAREAGFPVSARTRRFTGTPRVAYGLRGRLLRPGAPFPSFRRSGTGDRRSARRG